MYKWTPETEGKGFEFSEILAPLEQFRDRINVVTNLAHPAAGGAGSDAGADHARSAAVYLSGAHPEKDSIRVGPTIDQIAAEKIGQDTPLPSIELSIEEVALSCGIGLRLRVLEHDFLEDADHSAARWRTIRRWCSRSCSATAAPTPIALARKQQSRSLLDSVMEQVALAAEGPARVRPHQAQRLSR